MKILAIITDGFGSYGGIAQYNTNLLRAMARSEDVSEIVVVSRSGAPQHLPAEVFQAKPERHKLRYIYGCLRRTIESPYDLVFCGHLFAAPLATAIASAKRSSLWVQAHGIEAWKPPSVLVRKAIRRSTLVTSVSRYTRRRLLEWADLDPTRVRVLPNTFSSVYEPRSKCLRLVEQYCLHERRVILTVSRISSTERYKGHERVLDALPHVLDQCPDVIYLIAGTGDGEPQLRELVERESLGDHVRFVGHVSPDDLPDIFSLADVFVMPSTGEGFGIVFLEAAAAGLPVIAGGSDGSRDALADGRIGVLIDPEDRSALVRALVSTLRGDVKPQPEEVRRFAFENFSLYVDDLIRGLVSSRELNEDGPKSKCL